MKKITVILLAISMLAVLAACSTSKGGTTVAAADEKTYFTGDAVVGEEGKESEILAEPEEGWEEAKKKAEDNAAAAGDKGPGGFNRSYEEKVVAVVNQERAKVGLGPVNIDETMMAGAEIRAQEQQSLFSHTRPDGRDCFSVFSDLGIAAGYRGENVAYASPCTPEFIMNGWMGSEGHKKNILDPRFTRIGVGYYESAGLGYWAQIFAE
ncbi:MAG: CAP domain-containing protein [Lachnospiraceae bacterium]|nr:CAP domain-containing protein [Lachnospiraceae bacterium]